MQMYLVRHGDAIDQMDPAVTSDGMRWLTDEGREETRWLAEIMRNLGVKPQLMLSSPLVRARQTGEIIAEVLGFTGEIQLTDDLIYGGAFSGILQTIANHGVPKQVILTGHMPSMGELAGWLAWNTRTSALRMRTAQVCRVDMPDDRLAPGEGDIRWTLPPKAARRLLDA